MDAFPRWKGNQIRGPASSSCRVNTDGNKTRIIMGNAYSGLQPAGEGGELKGALIHIHCFRITLGPRNNDYPHCTDGETKV